jgi:hypothetical protein
MIASSTPFTKAGESASPKRRAISTASSMTTATGAMLDKIHDLLLAHAGGVPVLFCFIFPDGKLVFLELHERFFVTPSSELIDALEDLIGEDAVWLKGTV